MKRARMGAKKSQGRTGTRAATPRLRALRRARRLTLLGSSRTPMPASPDEARLETFDNLYPGRDYVIEFDCPEFTAVCPITGQPDFGHLVIRYIPRKRCVESKSLKLYLHSFRNVGAFHEEVVNRVLADFVAACRPAEAEVAGAFRPRGGITLKVTARYPGTGKTPRLDGA
jgi:7-cyano-7-deazaguanine reductase